ncbi:MAG TPA: TolC family protein [Pirellulales bacterium]|nr:TolC family protein [Pirellulales bacterium]
MRSTPMVVVMAWLTCGAVVAAADPAPSSIATDRAVWGSYNLLPGAEPAAPAEPVAPAPAAANPQGIDLTQATALAEANSPRLRAARAAVDQAYGQMIQAGLYPNPRVDNGNPQFILGGVNSVYNVGLTQTMVTAGKLRLSRAAAGQSVRQEELTLIRTWYDLLTDVRQQFFAVVAAQQRIEILEQLVTILHQSEKTSTDLLGAGRVSETDVLLTRIEREQAQAKMFSQQQQIVGSRRQLAATLGLPSLPIERVDGELNLRITILDQGSVAAEALARNAEVRRAEVDVTRNQVLLSRARAEPVPNIIWQGGYQRTLSEVSPSQGTIGVYLDVPIWDRNQGNIRSASASVRQALAALGITQNEIIAAAANAEARYRAAQAVVENYERGLLPDARRSVELIQKGYEQGLFDILRLLQAQRALVEANLDYITAQLERLDAAAELAGILQLEQFP